MLNMQENKNGRYQVFHPCRSWMKAVVVLVFLWHLQRRASPWSRPVKYGGGSVGVLRGKSGSVNSAFNR